MPARYSVARSRRGSRRMWLYLRVRQRRSMNTLSIALPTPSMEIFTPASKSTEVKVRGPL